jgi:hypothetical protein
MNINEIKIQLEKELSYSFDVIEDDELTCQVMSMIVYLQYISSLDDEAQTLYSYVLEEAYGLILDIQEYRTHKEMIA